MNGSVTQGRSKTLKVLLIISHHGLIRTFESTVRALLLRGHSVHVCFEVQKGSESADTIRFMAKEFENLTFDLTLPKRGKDAWFLGSMATRLVSDYVRFLDPAFNESTMLRDRVARRIPAVLRGAFSIPGARSTIARRVVIRVLRALDRAAPLPAVVKKLEHHSPDIVLVTPLVALGATQVDFVRWARAHGWRTGVPIPSWDNLTTKGIMHEIPDSVFVWNETQLSEAVNMHGVPDDRVVVTGAPGFDHWFGWKPHLDREGFCRQVGLEPDLPYVLYLASSLSIAPDEASFISRWAKRLREEVSLGLDNVQILVRPHPLAPIDGSLPSHADLEAQPGLQVWPRQSVNPTDMKRRQYFYDSMHYASAVVGLNTTALIEAAVAGRQTFTLLAPEYRATQHGTIHFRYLLAENDGPLVVAKDWVEHATHIADAIRRGGASDHRPFLCRFVRPAGLEKSAADQLADAIEATAAGPCRERYRQGIALRPVVWMIGRGVRWHSTEGKKDLFARGRLRPAGRVVAATLRRLVRYRHLRTLTLRIAAMCGGTIRYTVDGVVRREDKFLAKRKRDTEKILMRARLEMDKRALERAVQCPSPTPPDSSPPPSDPVKHLVDEIECIVRSGNPVIAGPWLGGVTLELLYWIPMLRGLVTKYPDLRERLTVISRGRVDQWYEDFCTSYLDVSDLISYPIEMVSSQAIESDVPGLPRPLDPSRFELDVLQAAAEQGGMHSVDFVHIAMLNRAYHRLAKRNELDRLCHILERQRLTSSLSIDLDLPSEFIYIHVAFNHALPDTIENRLLFGKVIATAGAYGKIVVSGLSNVIDRLRADGLGFTVIPNPGQSTHGVVDLGAVASAARLVICPYGGLSCIAAHHAVPSIGIWSDPAGIADGTALQAKRLRADGLGEVMRLHVSALGSLEELLNRAPVVMAG